MSCRRALQRLKSKVIRGSGFGFACIFRSNLLRRQQTGLHTWGEIKFSLMLRAKNTEMTYTGREKTAFNLRHVNCFQLTAGRLMASTRPRLMICARSLCDLMVFIPGGVVKKAAPQPHKINLLPSLGVEGDKLLLLHATRRVLIYQQSLLHAGGF